MMSPHAAATAYLGITNAFALLRLLPGSDRDKDTEILARLKRVKESRLET